MLSDTTQLNLPATIRAAAPGTATLLLHGLGQGRWIFSGLQRALLAAGQASVAVDLPGHGELTGQSFALEEVVQAVCTTVGLLEQPRVVGVGLGGYIGQRLAERVPTSGLALVGSWPHAGIPWRPDPRILRHLLRADIGGARGLHLANAERRAQVAALWTPLSPRLIGAAMLARRAIEVVRTSVLVCTGGQDLWVPWRAARRLGESLDAVIWRYDDLGHTPLLQAAGARLERDLVRWLSSPHPRKVREVDGWAPEEGRGIEGRMWGTTHGNRSAYGQRAGRDADYAVSPWDQNHDA